MPNCQLVWEETSTHPSLSGADQDRLLELRRTDGVLWTGKIPDEMATPKLKATGLDPLLSLSVSLDFLPDFHITILY
jgi:hypothetical protein